MIVGARYNFKSRDFSGEVSAITATVRLRVCGNNAQEGSEQCDGTDFGAASCASQGFGGGTLSCSPACEFITEACLAAETGVAPSGGGISISGSSTDQKTESPIVEKPTSPASIEIARIPGVPSRPVVVSSTHPDSKVWYSNNNPQFSWTLPLGVDAVSYYLSKSLTSTPSSVPDGLFATKSYKNIEDGIWYFHIKMRNTDGWGGLTHFKVKIGKGEAFPSAPIIGKTDSTPPPIQNLGKRNIVIEVTDNTGSHMVIAEERANKALEKPVIRNYSKELQSGQALTAGGSIRYPNYKVTIWLQREKDIAKSFSIQSDMNGDFAFRNEEKLRDGTYRLWAGVEGARGVKSAYSEKATITVTRAPAFPVGTWANTFLHERLGVFLKIGPPPLRVWWTRWVSGR